MRASFVTALAGVLAVASSGGAFAANTVGDVLAVQQRAYGTPPNASKEAKREGDGVAYREMLETQQKSGLLVEFTDGSKLTLGANSKVLVDDFVYAPENSQSKALVSIPAGTLRYVTGAMPKGQTTIQTPTATMVLRGTNVTVGVGPNGETHLQVTEGLVSVHNTITGEDVEVGEGDGVNISTTGIDSSSDDETGDALIDDGFTATDPATINSKPEERRGERQDRPASRPSKSKSGNNANGGGTPGG